MKGCRHLRSGALALLIIQCPLLPCLSAKEGSDEIAAIQQQVANLTELVQQQQAEIALLKSALENSNPKSVLADIEAGSYQRTDTGSEETALGNERYINMERQPLGSFPDDAIVTAGDFSGSLKIPGTDASVRLGGFVQMDSNFDFDHAGAQFSTLPTTIPLDGSTQDGTTQSQFHARFTRFNLDYRSKLPDGSAFRTFFEVDFFGDGDEFNNNYDLRLRHAAAQLGNLYFGQWWSSFNDMQAAPETADLVGPLGLTAVRNPGIRWVQNLDANWTFGLGVENAAGDLSGDSALLASDSVPNTSGYVQLKNDWGRLRLSGVLLRLDSTQDEAWAGGANFSGRLNLPFIHPKDNLAFAFQFGSGFTHYYTGFTSRGLEGVVDARGNVEPTEIFGGFLAYQHWWSERWRSTFSASMLDLDSPIGSDSFSFDNGEKYIVNLIWSPYDRVTLGLEYIYATRETVGDGSGDGSRLHFSSRFDF